MPISFPMQSRKRSIFSEPNTTRFLLRIVALFLVLSASGISAQVLAHPGWTRSGFAVEPWYHRAVFYQVRDASPDFKALTERLDAVQSTGISAVIVSPPALPSLAGASAEQAIAAQSALDAFDNFTRQATAHGIRVLVTLPAAHADADLAGRIRFWLTRGVAGVRLEIPPEMRAQDRANVVKSARTLVGEAGGQRVVLVDGESGEDGAAATGSDRNAIRSGSPSSTPQLEVRMLTGPLTAAALRPQIAAAFGAKETLLDVRADHVDAEPLERALATIALAGNSGALIDPARPLTLASTAPPPEPVDEASKPAPAPAPAQPPPGVYLPYVPYFPPPRPEKRVAPLAAPTDPFTEWVAKLAALHASNNALRNGTKTPLDFDAQNVLAWVAKPTAPTPQNPAVVVLCNLSAQPVELSLVDAAKKLNLHGFFLRKLVRSDNAMGAEDIAAVKLAPYSVFIGEMRR